MLGPIEEMLARANGSFTGSREQLDLVHRNTLRLLKLVNTLLHFSRIEAGRIEAVYEPTDLAAYTTELASVFRSAIERAGLKLSVDCPALPESVYVDREMWETVVLNLLSNAFKFTFEGADDYLIKPFSVGELLARIDAHVRRKRAEEALRQSEERFRRYFELGLIGMAITSPTTGILEVNDHICEILGYERSELVQMTWAELTHPDDLAADVTQFKRVLAGEIDGYAMDKRWIRKDSQVIDATVSVKCLRRADGSVDYFVALLQDVTERERTEEALRRAHDELEQRVIERTSQLSAIKEELIKEITEHERAEEQLRRSEAYLAEGQRISHTGSWAVKFPSEDVFWSQEVYRIYGLDPATTKLSQQMAFHRIHPEDRPFVKEAFERALREKSDYAVEHRAIFPGGLIKHLQGRGHPVLNEAGTLTEYVGTVMDITERKRAEVELALLKDELAADLEGMKRLYELSMRLLSADGLQSLLEEMLSATINLQQANFGNVQLYNPQTKHLEIVVQRGFTQEFLDHFSVVAEDSSACGRALQRGERVIIEDVESDPGFEPHRQIAASAGFRAVQSTPLVSRSGELLGMLSTHLRDPHRPSERELRLTDLYAWQVAEMIERKRAEEALHETRAALAHVTRVMAMGELIASIAHEVNQPLGAIVTNGQACLRLLARESPDLDKSREVIERMTGDGMRASDVITRIRALLKKNDAEKALLHVNELIQEVIALTSTELSQSQIRLHTALAAGLPPVLGDRVQVQQVILNLLLNAKEAMSGVGWKPRDLFITSLATISGEAVVAVRDSGTGLDPGDYDRIFAPFFTTKAEGLGLGLSISRRIIEAHGGRLWATANEDQDAIIQFALPTGGKDEERRGSSDHHR